MRVYRSNRMEVLSRQLAEVLRHPVPSGDGDLQTITTEEVVVVHSQGMARWLAMELARHLGVCANIAFPFPKAMVRQSVGAVLGEQEDAWKVWRPDGMLWGTLKALEGLLAEPAFAPLADYLRHRSGQADPVAGLGHVDAVLLAREIADIFDRYISYRPDLVAHWDQGGGEPTDWQPHLWRALKTHIDSPHLGAMVHDLEHALASGAHVEPARLPPRLCLFGISTLPPFYLDLFSALTRIREVHLFILSPSDAYWGDIRSKRERARMLRQMERSQGTPGDVGALHLDEGNPLLASFGRLGRDFQVVLEGRDTETHYQEPCPGLFVDPAEASETMLHVLQSDILHVRQRGEDVGLGGAPRLPADPEDVSVRVHACYGAMRQVEALRDDLLSRFAADPTLQPRDVVVMTPDVERFAPIVEAVFGDAGADPEIPFRLSDRAMARENPVAEALDRVMRLVTERLTGHALLDLFALPVVQQRFGLHDDDMPTLKGWIQTTGIRWGIDADDRERHDQPGYTLNTWRFGLDRMLLGVAMPGEERDTFGGVLPYDEIEGGDAIVLGRLADACDVLFTTLRDLEAPRSMTDWVETLKTAVERMTAVNDMDAWRVQQVHEALDALGDEAESATHDGPLDRAAVHALLQRRLSSPRRAAGFLTGAVTFCAMVPMRSVPFRVVALLGMDEESFPRKARGLGFDLTWRHPRLGDRNPREEDRYLMLEALLAARDALVITYSGQDPQTGEVRAPATPVDEVLEVLASSFALPEGLDPVVEHHPLHPFSPSLFGITSTFDEAGHAIRRVEPPRSYDARRLAAAARMLGEPVGVPSLVRGSVALEDDADGEMEVTLTELIDFFKNPSKGFLYRRIGVYLDEGEDALEDREPTHIDAGLGEWAVRNSALEQVLAGGREEAVYERMRLSGTLPLGEPGRVAFDQATAQVPAIYDEHQALVSGDPDTVPVDLCLDGVRLVGRLDRLYPAGRVVAHASSNSPKHLIGLWLPHLVRRAMGAGPPAPSHLVGRAGREASVLTLGTVMSVADAQRHLTQLLRYYWVGQQAPLLFFPSTSYAYADALRTHDPSKPGSPDVRARAKAADAWDNGGRPGAEAQDAYNVALHGELLPFAVSYSMEGVTGTIAPPFASVASDFWSTFLEEVVA